MGNLILWNRNLSLQNIAFRYAHFDQTLNTKIVKPCRNTAKYTRPS